MAEATAMRQSQEPTLNHKKQNPTFDVLKVIIVRIQSKARAERTYLVSLEQIQTSGRLDGERVREVDTACQWGTIGHGGPQLGHVSSDADCTSLYLNPILGGVYLPEARRNLIKKRCQSMETGRNGLEWTEISPREADVGWVRRRTTLTEMGSSVLRSDIVGYGSHPDHLLWLRIKPRTRIYKVSSVLLFGSSSQGRNVDGCGLDGLHPSGAVY